MSIGPIIVQPAGECNSNSHTDETMAQSASLSSEEQVHEKSKQTVMNPKRVRFSRHVTCREAAKNHFHSPHQNKVLWYSRSELKEIKRKTREMCLQQQQQENLQKQKQKQKQQQGQEQQQDNVVLIRKAHEVRVETTNTNTVGPVYCRAA
ncbi:expressed unknown protein [Seminavis robusta]|uniref:Uncharacterized protein n=1 Tax=Seminavis robusta TaxID=568900 RepID=A0A9N8E2Q0_9STRA|nr:expressed unknown protein [Seminavis robusta]|eukprot:Sro594_g172490.1 n/a (150) ;mRNA; r:34139-34588